MCLSHHILTDQGVILVPPSILLFVVSLSRCHIYQAETILASNEANVNTAISLKDPPDLDRSF